MKAFQIVSFASLSVLKAFIYLFIFTSAIASFFNIKSTPSLLFSLVLFLEGFFFLLFVSCLVNALHLQMESIPHLSCSNALFGKLLSGYSLLFHLMLSLSSSLFGFCTQQRFPPHFLNRKLFGFHLNLAFYIMIEISCCLTQSKVLICVTLDMKKSSLTSLRISGVKAYYFFSCIFFTGTIIICLLDTFLISLSNTLNYLSRHFEMWIIFCDPYI